MLPFEKSVVCPILIGRDAELQTIADLRAQTQRGTGRVLLIAGEAGLGKTRLADESVNSAAAAGWAVLRGACSEVDQAAPYGALIDMLRIALLNEQPANLREILNGAGAPFANLLPELAQSADSGPPERQIILPAMLRLCARLAGARGMLMVVEDLHWADDATIDLLLYLARHIATLRIMLLLTYRRDEAGPALRQFLAQLDRQRLATEISLTPMSLSQIDNMVRTIFEQPHPVRAEFLDTIYTLTEGNPFFVEEILKSMLAAGEIFYHHDGRWDRKPLHELHIPRSVDEALYRRSQQLSPAAYQLLTLAAVAGRRFDFTLLQHLTNDGEAELVPRIKELIAAQFLVEEDAEHFAFRHALTRQAIYGRLLARERRQLHQRIGDLLLTQAPNAGEAPIAELAYHFSAGERWDAALTSARQAAEHALRLHAPITALTQIGRALTASARLGRAAAPDLLLLRGRAHAMLSEFDAAHTDLAAVLQEASTFADIRIAWEALVALGDLWATRDYRRAGEYFAQALEFARNLNDTGALAATLNHVGNWHMNQERPGEALRLHEEALTIFQQAGDRAGVAQTLDLLGITRMNCGDPLAARECFNQAISLMRQLDDHRGLVHSLAGLSLCIDFRDARTDIPLALESAAESARIARGLTWRSGEALALICRGLALIQLARYGQALATLREALVIAEEIEHLGWTADCLQALGSLHLELLAFDEARVFLEDALERAHLLNSMIWQRHSAAVLIVVALELNDLARARQLLAASALPDDAPTTLGEYDLLVAQAELLLAAGQPDAALAIAERLLKHTGRREPGAVVPHLGLLHGRALAKSGRMSEAATALSQARDAAQTSGRRDIEWRARAELARVLLALGDTLAGAHEIGAARDLIAALAATLGDAPGGEEERRLAEQFSRRALARLPVTVAPRDDLTPREREVANLVAQGKTNREIATLLVVSERTAERHIANIMAKLGVHNRAQIAAYIVRDS